MKKIIITTITILCLGNAIAQKKAKSILKEITGIEKELNKALEISKTRGFAVAIVKGNEIIYAKGFGYSDYENKVPVTTNTVFCVGSSTKAFTASLIGILQDQGKVNLEASPRTYIPELQFYNSEMNAQITVKDLMTHRTGLPRHDAAWKTFTTQSKEELLARIAFQEPIAPVRAEWHYNNFMYLLQGVIAERLTHKTWGQNIEQNLFKPLDMTSSSTSIKALKNDKRAAIGYYFEEGTTTKTDYYDIAAMEPAGAINSTAIDMSKWMIAWLNNGQYNKKQVLPSNYVKEAISSQMVVSGKLPRETDPNTFMMNYGYGWFVSSYKGHYRVDHSGNIDGFTANVALYPSDNMGIVVLTNQDRSGLPEIVRNIIADKLFNTAETNWMELLEKKVHSQTKLKEAKTITSIKPVHDLKQYTGTYIHKGYGTFDVVIENDSLFAKLPLETLWLNPVNPNLFETYYVIDNQAKTKHQGRSLNFTTNLEGKISGLEMELERTLDPILFNRTPLKTNSTKEENLQAYIGEYAFKNMVFKVATQNNQLQMTINDKQLVQLLNTDVNTFSVVGKEGFTISFTVENNKTASDLTLHQPNGTFTAKRK
jgi:CubicO group peptidase (beta-lactamase class C family)